MSFTDFNLTFGKQLKELKNKNPHLTWGKVHDETGIAESTIYSYMNEKNPKSPCLDNAIALAKYFKVPLSYLCGEIDENNINKTSVIEAFFIILTACKPQINIENREPILIFDKFNNDNSADMIKQFLTEYQYYEKLYKENIMPENLLNDYKEDLKQRYAFIPDVPDYLERIALDNVVKEKRKEITDKEYS